MMPENSSVGGLNREWVAASNEIAGDYMMEITDKKDKATALWPLRITHYARSDGRANGRRRILSEESW